MNDLERLATRGDERGSATVFERASHGPVVRDTSGRPLVLVGAAVVIAAAVIGVLAARDAREPIENVTVDVPPPVPVFGVDTGTTLVFDDGYSGVVQLDLDTGATERREVHNRAGDQPYRLHRTGDRLVVGWQEVWSTDLHGGNPVQLGEATIFVPAYQEGFVWLVDYPGDGIGNGIPTMQRVGVFDGAVVESLTAPDDDALPVRGVYGGMAYANSTTGDITVRDESGAVVGQLGRWLGDVHGTLVAWCETAPTDDCHVTDLATGHDVAFTANDPRYAVNLRASSFSPDGSTLAVESGAEILLVDVATGEVTVAVTDRGADAGFLDWSDDGTQLFWSSNAWGVPTILVGRHDVVTGESEHHTLDVGSVHSFIAVPTGGAKFASFPAVQALVDDARNGTPGATAPIGEFLRLLLGRENMSGLPPGEYTQPAAWGLGDESVLDLLATPGLQAHRGPVDGECLGGSLPEPTTFDFDDEVVLAPPTASCADWFALEVFLADAEIVAIALVRNADVPRAEMLVAFARGEGAAPFLAPEVRLLLGREEQVVRSYTELQSADGWVLEVDTWGAFTGPFSALDPLADRSVDELVMTPGPLRQPCAGPPVVEPPTFAFDTALTITPKDVDSCLDWFALELFAVGDQIVAVSLWLSEP